LDLRSELFDDGREVADVIPPVRSHIDVSDLLPAAVDDEAHEPAAEAVRGR
jgi:hypothetical protein